MTVGKSTSVFLETYSDDAPAPTFLTSLARARAFRSQKVTIDIERDTDDIAIVIQDLQDGGRDNTANLYQNNEYLPPIYKEEAPLNSFSLLERRPGQDPHQDPVYAANLAMDAAKVLQKMDKKIRRSVELQASQVLQTGKADLKDKNGVSLYTIDYSPKAANFPQVATSWSDTANATPLLDLESLAHQLNDVGRGTANRVIFGRTAWQNFVRNDEVQKILDNRRISLGAVDRPRPVGGAVFMGDIAVGPYLVELWTYTGKYKDPNGGAITRYVDDNNAIMLSDNTRIDAAYGALPYVAGPEQRALQFLPQRRSANGGDMTWNSWIIPDGSALYVSAGTRPLYIPTAIDTFGTLNTVAP
jgi:hypothetical protein